MTDTTKGLSADDVRALFSDHLEGTLEPAVQQQVDEALASDPALSAERRDFGKTVSLLQGLPSSEAPANLVGLVRDRLAAERRSQQQQADVIPIASARPAWRTRGVELMAGLCAAAAVVAVVVMGVPALRGPSGGDGAGMLTAGGSSASSVSLSWRAPGVERIDVVAAAQQAGLAVQEDGSFVGDRQAAARFLVALKTKAATGGSDVSGTVPEQAERVVVVVVP
ncbi:MAG: hypothetical protein Q8O67_24945 [Deltaproteobacteria bacterium]|nr:hypothetical protein [Deltaproteobacteria bacterium]